MGLFNLGAPSWLWEAINSLWLMLCKWIYIGINWFYQVFMKIASVNLFSTEVFKEITGRIYVVMGIAMLFIFAYNLVLMIINPDDKKGSGATGKVVKETMISLTVVVLLPTIFNWMYIFQSHLLESNVIGQIIMGSVGSTSADKSRCKTDDYDCLCEFDKFEELEQYNNTNVGMFWSTNYTTQGNQALIKQACETYRGYNGSKITDSQRGAYSIAPTVFSAFYRPTNFDMDECENYLANNDTSVLSDDKDRKICVNYYFDLHMSKYTGNIQPFVSDSYLNGIISDSTDKSMEFNWPFALIAGGLAVWMFICYAMEIGVRVAKLGLLQIISPIAVMMRVIPGQKEKMFDKWFSQLKNTYLDVFIRLVIIYFALFAISLVPDVLETLWISNNSGDGNAFIKILSMVVIILGILKFAQEAPALLKEFFGGLGSGSFSLKSPSKQLSENKLGGAALGMAGGAAASTVGNLFNAGRRIASAQGGKNKAKAVGRLFTAPFSGAVGGAFRGAKQGYGATGFKDLGGKIAEAKYQTDEAFERGFVGSVKYKVGKAKDNAVSFGQFISGTGPTNREVEAADGALGGLTRITSEFSSKGIEQIIEAFTKLKVDFNQEKDFKLGGYEYTKRGDEWYKKDSAGNPTGSGIDNKKMGDDIKEHFDGLKRDAYVAEFAKNAQAYERLTNGLIDKLNDNLPKLGKTVADNLNGALKNCGVPELENLVFNSSDEITNKIGEMMTKIHNETDTKRKDELRGQLYTLNDSLEKALKSARKDAVIAQQDKKDK